MQRVVDLIHNDKAAVDPETVEAMGGVTEMFQQGRLGMHFSTVRESPTEDVDFEWGYAPLPSFPGNDPVIFAAIEASGVPAEAAHAEEAAAFAAFLMSDESQQILAETKNIIPINRAAAEVWAESGQGAGRDLILQSVPYARTLPFAVGFGRVQDLTWPLFGEVFLGQRSVDEALEEAVPLANEALAEAGGCLGPA